MIIMHFYQDHYSDTSWLSWVVSLAFTSDNEVLISDRSLVKVVSSLSTAVWVEVVSVFEEELEVVDPDVGVAVGVALVEVSELKSGIFWLAGRPAGAGLSVTLLKKFL